MSIHQGYLIYCHCLISFHLTKLNFQFYLFNILLLQFSKNHLIYCFLSKNLSSPKIYLMRQMNFFFKVSFLLNNPSFYFFCPGIYQLAFGLFLAENNHYNHVYIIGHRFVWWKFMNWHSFRNLLKIFISILIYFW